MAARAMARESPGHTLQPTALLHEAWVRLRGDSPAGFRDRAHFLQAAAQAMRRVLVDHARRRLADKRGAGSRRVTFHDLAVECIDPQLDVLALHEALDAFAAAYPRPAEVVKLRYFSGLSVPEVAETLELSPATVKREWVFARAWIHERIDSAP